MNNIENKTHGGQYDIDHALEQREDYIRNSLEYEEWGKANMRSIISIPRNMEHLEQMMSDFNSMPLKHRMRSDDESMRLFGKTNKERYDEFKSILIDQSTIEGNDDRYNFNPNVVISGVLREGTVMDRISLMYDEAIRWAKSAMRVIIMPAAKEEDLDQQWIDFRSQPRKQQRESDWKSIELFGKDNETLYNEYKAKLLGIHQENAEVEQFVRENFDESYIDKKIRFLQCYTDLRDDHEYIVEACEELKNNYDLTFVQGVAIDSLLNSTNEMVKRPDTITRIYPDSTFISEDIDFEQFTQTIDFMPPENERVATIYSEMTELWYSNPTQERKDSLRESIMSLGWNPDKDLTNHNIALGRKELSKFIESNLPTTTFIDLSENVKSAKNAFKTNFSAGSQEELEKPVNDENALYPIFIVLLDDMSILSKDIKSLTKGPYTHSGISIDPRLSKIYSYNQTNKKNGGFSRESVERYPKTSEMAVYSFFVRHDDYNAVISLIDHYLDNREQTSYSYANMLSVLFKSPMNRGDFKLICSQFVDKLLKFIDVDLTKIDSSIVSPNDLYRASKANRKVYTLYEGPAGGYNPNKVIITLNKLMSNGKSIKEAAGEIGIILEPIEEVKKFPLYTDKQGDIVIKNFLKNPNKIDFNAEYAKSHRLLKEYEQTEFSEGLKYELCRLWYFNNRLEYLIYNKNDETKRKDWYKVRALILNDFKKYINVVLEKEPDFNFDEYFKASPFDDGFVSIDKGTIKFTIDLIKSIV